MKSHFMEIGKAFFQAEDSEAGMCAKLKKSMYGTRDAPQNGGHTYTQFMQSIGFKKW